MAQLEVDEIVFVNTGLVLCSTAADPSSGEGLSKPIGSLALRNNSDSGELWSKTGAAVTDWTLVSP